MLNSLSAVDGITQKTIEYNDRKFRNLIGQHFLIHLSSKHACTEVEGVGWDKYPDVKL